MNNIKIPDDFKTRALNTHGEVARAWLNNLDKIIQHAIKAYNLTDVKILPRPSYNYIATAKQNNDKNIVIKFCFPGSETDNEIAALEFMQGDGIVKLFDVDSEQGILLLEQVEPGEMLTSIKDDNEVICIAATLMQKLWKTIELTTARPTTQQWFSRLDRPINLPDNFPSRLIDKAKQLAQALHQNMNETVLLHGDLHHTNILSSKRQPWLAIDPKGVIGEREYEVGALLRNPFPDLAKTANLNALMSNRVSLLAELLSFDKQKIIAWGFSQAVLAAVWSLDANDPSWQYFVKCAEALN